MHQYAGKYMGKGGNSSGASAGYQQYMHQYAEKYMGNGGNTSGASAGYQQYMQQYAEKYMGGAQNTTVLSSKKASAGGYQQYMHQYADKYMGNGGNTSGASAGYQQYMHQYADKYMGGGDNTSGASASQGYQQYMQQYAGKYMKQFSGKGSNTTDLQSLNSQSPADCTTWQCLCDLKMGQTHQFKVMIPAPYSDNAIENREREYKKELDAFAAKANVTLAELGLSK